VLVDRPEFFLGDANVRTVLIVRVVAEGNQRVESVVAAGQLEHYQYFSVVLTLSGERRIRLREQGQR
jgi:hypothetical protein